jgi:hypothetical protein
MLQMCVIWFNMLHTTVEATMISDRHAEEDKEADD